MPLARERTRGRLLLGSVIGAMHRRSRARTGRPSRLAAAVSEHAMTFAGMAAIDVGVFHWSVTWGWVAAGVSVLLADFKIQG